MMDDRRVRQLTVCALTMLGMTSMLFVGCARLPYTTKVVYEGPLVQVALQQEVKSAGYSHPAQLTAQEVAAILRGFSLREEQRLPLRWFAEEAPPKKLSAVYMTMLSQKNHLFEWSLVAEVIDRDMRSAVWWVGRKRDGDGRTLLIPSL